MKKSDIIKIVDEFTSNSENKFADSISNNDNTCGKIGNNQFRNLATVCRCAECFEEMELLIKYNYAKAPDRWTKPIITTMLDAMEKIKQQTADDENVLYNLSLFFGYLYWQARIITEEGKR